MKQIWSKVMAFASGHGHWIAIGALVMMVAEKAVTLCAFPMWHYEPEVPAHLRGKMEQ